MGRNITDALAEWVAKQQTPRRQDAQVVAFLAVRADVATALEAGYSVKTVWAFLKDEGRITSSYEAFRRHVQRHIRSGQKGGTNGKQVTRFPADERPSSAPAPAQIKDAKGIGTFKHNTEHKREDLI
jgi:hypothetical protein